MQNFVKGKSLAIQEQQHLDNARDLEDLNSSAMEKDLKMPVPAVSSIHSSKDKKYRRQASNDSQGKVGKTGKSSKTSSRNKLPHDQNINIYDDDQARLNLMEQDGRYHDNREQYAGQSPAIAYDQDDFDDVDGFDELDQPTEAKSRDVRGYPSIEKQLQGDSYADTTSGQWTNDDNDEIAGNVAAPQYAMSSFVGNNTLSQPAHRRTHNTHHNGQSENDIDTHYAPIGQTTVFQREHTADTRTFAFSAMNKRGPQMHQQPARHQPRDEQQHGQHDRQIVQHKPPEAISQSSIMGSMNRKRDRAVADDSKYGPIAQDNNATDTSAGHEDAHLHSYENEGEQATQHYYGQDAQDLAPDYDEAVLRKKCFDDLKAEDFDHDPRAKQLEIPGVEPDAAMTQKLQALHALSPDKWHDFFALLKLAEWEEAGDWFIDRFSDVLGDLKDLRRSRREAAQAFEAEVEQRQKALDERRIVIDSALKNMRESGAQLLKSPKATTG